jgi:hypothetical protein
MMFGDADSRDSIVRVPSNWPSQNSEALSHIAGAVSGAFVGMRLGNLTPRRMLPESILAGAVIVTIVCAVKI